MLQYENALTTRVIWLKLRGDNLAPDEKLWLERYSGRVKSPPLIETLTALTYLPDGRERVWVATLLTSVAWIAGGLFLFDLCRRLPGGRGGATLATAYYWLNPFSIVVSRSFQHEALMMLAFLIALWSLVALDAPRSWWRTAVAGVIAGVAVLAKPGIFLFPLMAAYLALALGSRGLRRTILSPKPLIYALLLAGPSLLYVWLLLPGESHQLMPKLLLSANYYRGWAVQIGLVVGWVSLLAGLGGAVLLLRSRTPYALLGISLFLGSVAYSLVFSYATMTHDYYHVPMLPAVAVGLSGLGTLTRRMPDWRTKHLAFRLVIGLALLAGSLLYSLSAFEPLRRAGAGDASVYEESGRLIGHGSRVICMSPGYGKPLTFHGWLIAHPWPDHFDKSYEKLRTGTVLSDAERWQRMVAADQPTHFVITDHAEMNWHPDLASLLHERYRECYRTKDVVIYDLRTSD
jgi:4-amino-4-deoxy-L-arabinose transferase-like glycosyltransferase